MAPHQQRVATEKEELVAERTKLKALFGTEVFAGIGDAEKERLRRQAGHMAAYSDVLAERIAAF